MEDQLKALQVKEQSEHTTPDVTPHIKQEETLPLELDPLSQHGGNRKYYNWDFVTKKSIPGSTQTYGLSSAFYFTDQLSSYLDATWHYIERNASEPLSSRSSTPGLSLRDALHGQKNVNATRTMVAQDPSRPDEEALLELYWTSWHVLHPILDETAFRSHYKTLWKGPSTRDPSALVDIVLALCIQQDAASKSSHATNSASDPKVPTDSTDGWWFYRRCQYFLQDDLEAPSVTTFQCHYLAVIWLSRASWNNAAHNVLAAGLRIGVILGLHNEPCSDLAQDVREFRRRLWWTAYAIDAQYAMEFGRPLGVHFGQVTCSLPKDPRTTSCNAPIAAKSSFFSTQQIKLVLAARAVYILFYRDIASVLGRSGNANLYQDPKDLEACAEWLEGNAGYLKAWVEQLPSNMKTARKGLGSPYSNDQSSLDLQPATHIHSQGCLILELLYHRFVMSLHRPFIALPRDQSSYMPITELHAMTCVNHAITITSIIHQDLTESDNLRAWPITHLWQWNATLTLIGYTLAYPHGLVSLTARKALNTAAKNFDILSKTFANADSAVMVLKDVMPKLDIMLNSSVPIDVTKAVPLASVSPPSRDASQLENGSDCQESECVSKGWERVAFNIPTVQGIDDSMANEDWVFDLLDFGALEQ